MSLPPERISIKRRRQDDPVETLYLEQGPARDKKRRATDFLFRRLRADEIEDSPQVPRLVGGLSSSMLDKPRSASQQDNSGIPQIRSTVPGDEVKDMKALKAAIRMRVEDGAEGRADDGVEDGANGKVEEIAQLHDSQRKYALSTEVPPKVLANARRFQLSREHDALRSYKQHGGIRKSVHRSKTQLATFIEKGLARTNHDARMASTPATESRVPGIKTCSHPQELSLRLSSTVEGSEDELIGHNQSQPFMKLPTSGVRKGHSIRTHPDTWDFDSDQLASELAAFAFELDSTGDNEPVSLASKGDLDLGGAGTITEDEYVYETYIRLPQNADPQLGTVQDDFATKVGVLVISAEDEELWEAYAESDEEEEDEWDAEDADSNAEDNPANDYPEDELSGDDEHDLGAYKHRRNASDDEEYDVERDD